MAAATTQLFPGVPGSISTTDEANGLFIVPNPATQNLVANIGISGASFSGVTLAIVGRIAGGTQFYPLAVLNQTNNSYPASSLAISLTDSTAVAFQVSLQPSAWDRIEVYVVSGTLTSPLSVEVSFTSGLGASPVVVAVNTAGAGSFTNLTASGTLAVTGTSTLTGNVAAGGTLSSTGNFAVNTNKVVITAASGNLASAGSILSTSASGGIGYATGAGGAVTQITSRTTGVTINTPTGAITLVSAAGSATPFTFTVTNSSVAALDTIVVSQKSGTDAYRVDVTAVAAGSFKLTITDLTGTTTETPVFNYAVVKGVAS